MVNCSFLTARKYAEWLMGIDPDAPIRVINGALSNALFKGSASGVTASIETQDVGTGEFQTWLFHLRFLPTGIKVIRGKKDGWAGWAYPTDFPEEITTWLCLEKKYGGHYIGGRYSPSTREELLAIIEDSGGRMSVEADLDANVIVRSSGFYFHKAKMVEGLRLHATVEGVGVEAGPIFVEFPTWDTAITEALATLEAQADGMRSRHKWQDWDM